MKLYIVLGLVFFMISCKPLERIERAPYADINDLIEEKMQRNSGLNYSMERIRMDIKTNQNINVIGKIYVIRNQAIFMNVQYFGLEIARILITEDSVKFVNRAERKYLFISMNDLRNKYYDDISLHFIQNLIVNGIILPDNVKIRKLVYYMKYEENRIVFSPDISPGQNLKMFYTNDMLLTNINFLDNRNQIVINADVEYNNNKNPEKIISDIILKSEKYKLELNIGRIENKSIQIPDVRINNNYSEIIF